MRWTPSQGAHAWSPGAHVSSCTLPNVSRTPTCCGGTAAQPADKARTSANPRKRFTFTSIESGRLYPVRLRFPPTAFQERSGNESSLDRALLPRDAPQKPELPGVVGLVELEPRQLGRQAPLRIRGAEIRIPHARE